MPPKRTQFSLAEKAALRAHHAKHPALSQQQLREWFEVTTGKPITQGTVSQLLSSRYSSLDVDLKELKQPKRLKQRDQAYPVLESILADWVFHQQHKLIITGDLLKEKALWFWHRLPEYNGIAEPILSNGWIQRFNSRFSISSRLRHGEAGSVDEAAMAAELASIQAKVAQYAPADQYNCDETGLFWKLVPDRSLATESLSGVKKEKARITIHHACNATGSHKLPMWCIGKYKAPRAFKAAGVKDIEALGVKWRWNKKAWMTTGIMVDWLLWFDKQMRGRKVLLLMDNFSAHVAAVNELEAMPQGLGLKNTEVVFLPPNSTSKLQPLNQGIIASFKARYRRRWLRFMLEEHELNRNALDTINVLKAIQFSIRAWDEVSSTTISSCWGHSKVNLNPSPPSLEMSDQAIVRGIQNDLLQLRAQHQIRELMDVNQLINPAEEEVVDSEGDIEEMLVMLHSPEEPESDNEEEQLPRIPPKQALQLLQSLKLAEIQSDDCSAESIRWLERYEKVVYNRHLNSLTQAGIQHYLITGTGGNGARDQIDPELV
jgi:hypothetical protein